MPDCKCHDLSCGIFFIQILQILTNSLMLKSPVKQNCWALTTAHNLDTRPTNVGTLLHFEGDVMHSISSREFNQDVGKAKRAAEQGPVFITEGERLRMCC